MASPGRAATSPVDPDAADTASPEEAALRVVFGYAAGSSASYRDPERLNLAYLDLLRQAGFDVIPFRLDVGPGALGFRELDRRWRWGDRDLLRMYERLENTLVGATAFINGPGVNLHPRFVERLPVVTAFQCFDDPENSAHLSQPVAPAYDLCLVGNVAEVERYRTWGARQATWIPMGLLPGYYDPHLTETAILEGRRDLDLIMLSDRCSPWRRARLDRLAHAFPDAGFYGPGWPRGFLPEERQVAMLGRARIGPNLHNSTGPVNFRTFYLPANGVLQICDNRAHLAQVFELDREAIGFDTIEECIELCRHYLAHPDEARRIAAAGWRRARRDYSEVAVHRRRLAAIREARSAPTTRAVARELALGQRLATRLRQPAYPLVRLAAALTRRVPGAVRRARRFLRRGRSA